MPAHGPGPYLAEAVASALAEQPAEVIVVEDGTDGVTPELLQGARLLRLPHVRRSRARNAGVDAAATPYVAFLDEDDVYLPGGLARQREALEASPDAALAFGRVLFVDGAGAPRTHFEDEQGRPLPGWGETLDRRFGELVARGATFEAIAELGGPIYTSATILRRDAFLAAGGFDPMFDAHEDLDLYLRLARASRVVPCLGEPVTAYRVHGANTRSDDLYRGTLGVTEKHLPETRGPARRALLERRVDALWGLGRFRAARREALSALATEPRLIANRRFAKRLVGLAAPARLLEARR